MLDISSIADIPFRERDPWALLNLDSDDDSDGLRPEDEDDDDDDAAPEGPGPDEVADAAGELGDWGPALDYYGYGYARVDEVWLTVEGDPEPLPPVRDALILALHSPDDAVAHDDDILLEFWIDDVTCEEADEDDDYAVTVMLSRFLAQWLPRICGDERAIVLALCNPHATRLHHLPVPGGVPLYYPLGNVTSWRDEPGDFLAGPGLLRLSADAWLRV
ncbi:hypothetical protein [Haliangium sp.]|uniref:hypothetical protein n=1 Tax=Haliangium sp. TaxID=2663208 RepID=UPI003D0A6C5C